MERLSKTEYYLGIANAVSKRSSCLTKHWGAVIVKDDTIVSTGYNGAPRKVQDCMERGFCKLAEYRRKTNSGRGTCYEQCVSVHAEMNAIIFANKEDLKDSTLYLFGEECNNLEYTWNCVENPNPCSECKKMIINAGIKTIVVKTSYGWKSVSPSIWTEDDITGGY